MANKGGQLGQKARVGTQKMGSNSISKNSHMANSPVRKASGTVSKSPAGKAFRQVKPDSVKPKTTGASSLVTGGMGSWSGAAGSVGGQGGKTYSGGKSGTNVRSGQWTAYKPNAVKAPSMTGHTQGAIPGNMMAHSNKTTPFENTGMQPKGGKIKEVTVGPQTNANAKTPIQNGWRNDSQYKGKLEASLPYALPSTSSWSGAAGSVGGSAGKTFGGKKGKS